MSKPQRVSTCIWFDDKAEDAATFYASLFPNSRIVEVNRYGPGQRMPEGLAMLVRFELEGVAFSALNGGPMFPLSEAVSLVVSCETQAELDRIWNALVADGGAESMCGWCKDRFGLSWQIIPAQISAWMSSRDAAAQGRMWEKLMGMRKIDIAALEAAFNG
ncbi:MAG: VOC family protein [Hyphomonadaceae bacterium]|nr:VOC family protein [Hyphomonadaceae bacterium]